MSSVIWMIEVTSIRHDAWDKPQVVRSLDHSRGWFSSLEQCLLHCSGEAERPFPVVQAPA